MKYNAEQVMNGIMSYADHEILGKLPTSGKWVMGTVMSLATDKVHDIVDVVSNNTIVQMLGIVDENGLIDVDELMTAMKSAADKYGNLVVDIPLMGRMSFSSADVDGLRNYIM